MTSIHLIKSYQDHYSSKIVTETRTNHTSTRGEYMEHARSLFPSFFMLLILFRLANFVDCSNSSGRYYGNYIMIDTDTCQGQVTHFCDAYFSNINLFVDNQFVSSQFWPTMNLTMNFPVGKRLIIFEDERSKSFERDL